MREFECDSAEEELHDHSQDIHSRPPAEHPGVSGDCMNFNNARPKPGVPKYRPPQHVIDEYTHRVQTVRCVCGWTGSSATNGGAHSDWSRHVAAFREAKP